MELHLIVYKVYPGVTVITWVVYALLENCHIQLRRYFCSAVERKMHKPLKDWPDLVRRIVSKTVNVASIDVMLSM